MRILETSDVAYRSLAERLLVQLTGMEDGPPERARLTVGAIPRGLPEELPIPSGAIVIGSVEAPEPWVGPHRTEVRVVLEMAADPAAAVAAVAETAVTLGWREPARLGHPEMGGFASWPDRSRLLTLCRGRGGPALHVAAAPAPGGGSEVRMTLRDDDGMCSGLHGSPADSRVLPILRPPAGTRLRGEGGGGGGGSWTSTAIAEGDAPVGDLVAHLARQLEAAGWGIVGGTMPEAVTLWTGGEGWIATLAVVALPAGGGLDPRRWLMLRADAVAHVDDTHSSPSRILISP